MPSSNKTTTLGLNRWLGSDKPRKDDFNQDNQLIDQAVAALTTRIGTLESSAGEGGSDALDTHIADTAIHCTEDEKTAWNAAANKGVRLVTYVGDGSFSRTISLGTMPKAGIVFAVGRGSYEINWGLYSLMCFVGFFSEHGACQPIEIGDGSITVYNQATIPDNGVGYKFNEADVTYVCVLWD